MNAARQNEDTQATEGVANRGVFRPPFLFLLAILMGLGLNRAWSLPFMPSIRGWLGPIVTLCAVLLYVLSYREFRATGTPVRGNKRTTTLLRTGPYRFSRNPIYLSFIGFVLGLSVWLNNLWLLVMLVPAVGVIASVVIPREERFLKRNFPDQYSSYRGSVRRWL